MLWFARLLYLDFQHSSVDNKLGSNKISVSFDNMLYNTAFSNQVAFAFLSKIHFQLISYYLTLNYFSIENYRYTMQKGLQFNFAVALSFICKHIFLIKHSSDLFYFSFHLVCCKHPALIYSSPTISVLWFVVF